MAILNVNDQPDPGIREGVRTGLDADAARASCVRVDPATAFQLALFAEDERVRDAAAESLWPRECVDRCEMEVSGREFASIPFAERVAALIIACAICIHPERATRHRCVPLHEFLVPERREDARVHAYRFGARSRFDRLVLPHGGERRWSHSAMFRLPRDLHDTTAQRRTWKDYLGSGAYRDCCWCIDFRKLRLDVPSEIGMRISRHHGRMQLVDHDGHALPQFGNLANFSSSDHWIEFDPSFLMRLESGRVAGGFFSYETEVPPCVSSRRTAATLSIEIGPSSQAPVVMRTLVGNLTPRYDVDAVVGRHMRSIPAFEGATIDDLDRIARTVGVWQGGFLRASFEHHPLRRRDPASRSHGAVAVAAANREVA